MLLVSLILKFYRDCFSRIYVWSPSVDLDPAWVPVRKYIYGPMGVPETEQTMFSEWDQSQVSEVIEQQRAISDYSRNKLRMKRQHGILIIIDDFADRPDVVASRKGGPIGGSWLTSLMVRGRHIGASCLVSSQMTKLVGPVVRANATCLFVFRLRSGTGFGKTCCRCFLRFGPSRCFISSTMLQPLSRTAFCTSTSWPRPKRRCSTVALKPG